MLTKGEERFLECKNNNKAGVSSEKLNFRVL